MRSSLPYRTTFGDTHTANATSVLQVMLRGVSSKTTKSPGRLENTFGEQLILPRSYEKLNSTSSTQEWMAESEIVLMVVGVLEQYRQPPRGFRLHLPSGHDRSWSYELIEP